MADCFMRSRNFNIDALRLLAVFGVIVLHFGLPGLLRNPGEVFFRFSVPFFFMVSGYFCLNVDVGIISSSY